MAGLLFKQKLDALKFDFDAEKAINEDENFMSERYCVCCPKTGHNSIQEGVIEWLNRTLLTLFKIIESVLSFRKLEKQIGAEALSFAVKVQNMVPLP